MGRQPTGRPQYTHNLRKRLEVTTETEDMAIAADAIQGRSVTPSGEKIPAAMGIPRML